MAEIPRKHKLKDTITELVVGLDARKSLHDRLSLEWSHIPDEEKPPLEAGKRITAVSTRVISDHVADIPPEVYACVKEAITAGCDQLAERRRAQRFG
jgi:hypothetical protein